MTREMGRLCAVVCVIALTCLTTACATSSSNSEASSSSIVALGDSVPRGTNCHCTPYPPLTSEGLTASTGKTVTATNDAVGGYTTSDVLHQLESDGAVIDHVRAARTVEIEVGANDVAYSKSCGVTVDCYAPHVPGLEKNLAAIVRRVHDLASGRKVLIVLLDYWSVWLGGQYAAAKGDAYVAAAEEMTDRVNTVIKSTAAEDGSAYVDLRAAFKGPDYAYDETHFLSNDGDHPNAAGHEQIAKATEAVIEKSLHR
jgi:lysophospholipase L1-like esterase